MTIQPIEYVYDKYQNSDKLSDAELAYGLTYFKDVADKLAVMGPVFWLAFIEANRVYLSLDGFQRERAWR